MADAASIPEAGKKSTRKSWRVAARRAAEFDAALEADGWLSPDTYGRDYASPTDICAVYMFLVVDDWLENRFHIAYVGMSTKLASRWEQHSTLRKIKKQYSWVKRLFKPTPREMLRSEERRYIQVFRPEWNIIGRVPGQ